MQYQKFKLCAFGSKGKYPFFYRFTRTEDVTKLVFANIERQFWIMCHTTKLIQIHNGDKKMLRFIRLR